MLKDCFICAYRDICDIPTCDGCRMFAKCDYCIQKEIKTCELLEKTRFEGKAKSAKNLFFFNLQKIALAYKGAEQRTAFEMIDYIEELLKNKEIIEEDVEVE